MAPLSTLPSASALRLRLLGAFAVEVGDRAVAPSAWRLRRAQHLLKLLALAPGHRLHRDQLLDTLWPEAEPGAAALGLRQVVTAARRALEGAAEGPFPALHLTGDHLALRPPGELWVDVHAFEAAAAAARRGGDSAACEVALALYAGDLLPDDPYADWAAGRREALRQSRLTLLLELARRQQAQGRPAAAAATLERLADLEPAHEEALAELMRLSLTLGRPREAARQYERLRAALRDQLDATPDPATQALYRQLLAEARAVEAAPRPVAGALPPHNLPAPLTDLIGREREQDELRRRLTDPAVTTRLVTLTGAGGVGKTRLAVATATAALADGLDGVWLIDLAALVDPALVQATAAVVLGVREERSHRLTPALIDALRGRTALLVLDNCEHLAGACAELVVALLSACPRLRILATSRSPLRAPGERIWRVPSLALPDPDQTDLARIAASAAVRLFVERARLIGTAFALTPATAPLVAAICRRLDGIPLAIELAVPWLRVLALPELAGRLDTSLALLTDDRRGVPPRHRTLAATLAWSYRLLAQSEQRLLRQLAVFGGGFTLAAAEAVADDDGAAPAPVLARLTTLVDDSLVVAEPDQGRYRLLETVRSDALTRLAASGEQAAVRARHAAYFLGRVAAARPALWGSHPRRAWWLDELMRDLDNLRVVWRWATEAGEVDAALRLAGTLAPFFLWRGSGPEGRQWLDAALALPGASAAPSHAQALLGLAHMARGFEHHDTAIALAEASLAGFRRHDDTFGRVSALINLGATLVWREEGERARPYLEEAVALCRQLDPSPGIGNPLFHLGSAALFAGDAPRARRLMIEAAADLRRVGDTFRWAHAELFCGLAALLDHDPGAARTHIATGLAATVADDDAWGQAIAVELIACLAAGRGQAEAAMRLVSAVEAIREAEDFLVSIAAYRRLRDDLLRPARAALTPAALAAAVAGGRTLSRAAAVAEAQRLI